MTVATISVLFTIIFAGLACDSGGSTDGDDSCDAPKDDRPAWCDDNADATVNPGSDTDEQGYCGDGVCSANENCDGCDFDCPCADDEVCTDGVCGEDPLKDYYWIEGTWECIEQNEISGCEIGIVDVEVTGWSIEQKAAIILNIKPCSNGFAQKTDTDFLFFGQSQTGKTTCNGKFNLTTNTVKIQSSKEGIVTTWKYQKL